MAVPKQKQSKSRSRKRRSHDALKPQKLIKCSHCEKNILPHTVCPFCGFYKDKEIINTLSKFTKKKG